MILFCQECGKKNTISPTQLDNGVRSFTCRICGDIMKIPEEISDATNSKSRKLSGWDERKSGRETSPRRLMIVDDSRLMRRVLREIFDRSDSIQVVAEASHGREALEMLPRFQPDVITLDIEMPHMDGLTTLKHMMIKDPVPTVMLSSLTREGAVETFDALKYGAVDFMLKPVKRQDIDPEQQRREIIHKVSLAAEVETDSLRYLRPPRKSESQLPPPNLPCNYLFAIGTSEGGYGSMMRIIPHLRGDLPNAFLVVLYAAPQHVDAFVRYVDHISFLKVKRAANDAPIEGGTCYVASGNDYVTVRANSGQYVMQVANAPFPTRRGSINRLMFSLAELMGDHAVGIILSGAGDDGVEGIHEIIRSGGQAMVQAPTHCFCRELPLAVINNCGINRILTDQAMVREINSFFDSARKSNRNGGVAGFEKNHSNALATANHSDAMRTDSCN